MTQPAQQPAGTPVPWARQAAPQQPRATSRVRLMVTGLPSWEPLPPGDILVQRRGRD